MYPLIIWNKFAQTKPINDDYYLHPYLKFLRKILGIINYLSND